MFPYSSRGGRQRSVSHADQNAYSLEYAVTQDLQTIVLPRYIQRLREQQDEAKEASAFSCFTHVFESTQLALLLRYPAHWKPHSAKALYGCVPVRCNYAAYVQWIYSIVSHCIISLFKSQSVDGDLQWLTSKEAWWCEMSLYVFTLYAFHEIATIAPAFPFDGQTINGDDERVSEEKRLRSYLSMGLQSNENPKILYRRSFPESNRIRCTVELYTTFLQLQNICYMFGPPSPATIDGLPELPQWIAYDLAQIVQRLLNPRDHRLELCAYLGPCSLEGYAASSSETRAPMTHVNNKDMATTVDGADGVNVDPKHSEDDDELGDVSTELDTAQIANDDSNGVSDVVLPDLLQEYIKLRKLCHLESPAATTTSAEVRKEPKRRRARTHLAQPVPTHDASLAQNAPAAPVDPMVQLLRLYSNYSVEDHPADSQTPTTDALPLDECDDEGEDGIGTSAMRSSISTKELVPPVTRVPACGVQDDDQSMISTWTNGTAAGVGQSALQRLLSKVGPTESAPKALPRQSNVAAKHTPQEYGDFFLNQGSSGIADGKSTYKCVGQRKVKNKLSTTTAKRKRHPNRSEIGDELSDASNSVSSLLSLWLEPNFAQQSRKETTLSDEDSASSASFSASSNPDDTSLRNHPMTGQMALSTLLSLAGVSKSQDAEEVDDDDDDLEV